MKSERVGQGLSRTRIIGSPFVHTLRMLVECLAGNTSLEIYPGCVKQPVGYQQGVFGAHVNLAVHPVSTKTLRNQEVSTRNPKRVNLSTRALRHTYQKPPAL